MKLTPGMRSNILEALYNSMEQCGACGEWHPIDWYGDCRDDAHREHPEDVMDLLMAAPELLECGDVLARLGLQSNRYVEDADFREAVDNMFYEVKQAKGGN